MNVERVSSQKIKKKIKKMINKKITRTHYNILSVPPSVFTMLFIPLFNDLTRYFNVVLSWWWFPPIIEFW